jgi:sarcosine oxidase subunit gamma
MHSRSPPTAVDAAALDLPQANDVASVQWAAPCCRFIFRGDPAAARAAGAVFGTMLPTEPHQSSRQLLSAALWLGPDEWLLLAPAGEAEHVAASIARGLAGMTHALVELSARNRGLVIGGSKAEAVLSAGCPLDLDGAAFPVGMCTRTLFAKAEIVLWRIGAEAFRIEVARSYLPYVIGLLSAAIRHERAVMMRPSTHSA